MKAIHMQTNREYEVDEIIGETVVLKNNKGIRRRISYELFKAQYQLSEGHLASSVSRKGEAQEVAEEVLAECEALVKGGTKPSRPKPAKKKKKAKKGEPKEEKKSKKKTTSKTKKGSKAKKGKVKSKGEQVESITLKQICEELNIKPSAARRILRKEGVEKPGSSWTWTTPTEVEKIKSLLK